MSACFYYGAVLVYWLQEGETSLHCAVANDHLAATKVLLDARCDVNIANQVQTQPAEAFVLH